MATVRQQTIPQGPSTADLRDWTFGAEHEWGDWDRRISTGGCGLDEQDTTMVNSNGIAVDPKGVEYPFGGELNTPPQKSAAQLGEFTQSLVEGLLPTPVVNYRSNLHIHVRVPGLAGDLAALKKVQRFISAHAATVFAFVEPIPQPRREDYPTTEAFAGAQKRYQRRVRSHHTVLNETRVQRQLMVPSLEDFYTSEVPQMPNGAPGWHLQPRAAMNLRQLLQTDTVEFRHFPGTLAGSQVQAAAEWCACFLEGALRGWMFAAVVTEWQKRMKVKASSHGSELFPKFLPYVHWQEERYRLTVLDGTVPREQARANIARFLKEDTANG